MSRKPPKASELPEFVFGHLSTSKGRVKQARMVRLGFYHDMVLDPPDPLPDQATAVSVTVGATVALERATLFYTTDGTVPEDPSEPPNASVSAVPMRRSGMKWDTLIWSYIETWTAEIPGQAGGTLVQYLIQGRTNDDRVVYCPFVDTNSAKYMENAGDVHERDMQRIYRDNRPQTYAYSVDNDEIPDWLREAVIYHIFVDRFAPDPDQQFHNPASRSGFYGGTLKGILSRLDYLEDLGVNCLWLSPIFPSPSHHGYDPIDYGSVEPRLGTDEDLDMLLAKAGERRIRVVLDYVASHCSNEHPAFVAALQDDTSSTYSWFRFTRWPSHYDSYYGVPTQPKLNSDNPQVRDYLIGHARGWLERGVSGFRLDHAHGSSHAFWSAFRAATRRTKADSAIFGEITEAPSYLRSYIGRMDGCLDFRLLELLRAYFAFDRLTASEFDMSLRRHFAYFGRNLVLPTFLDNHDMNRFIWTVGGDKRRLRLAALCQFTLPGPPIIYYGTEVGLSQIEPVGRLEESRLPMLWGDEQDKNLLSFYRDLIALRRENTASWRLPRETMIIDDSRGLYAYNYGSCIVILNNGSKGTTVSLYDRPEVQILFASEPGTSLEVHSNELHLPPLAGAVCQHSSV